MIETERALVVDIDGTLCPIKHSHEDYADLVPEPRIIEKIRALHIDGWHIILSTARGMRSNDGNPGKITKNVGPTLLKWLVKHDIPFDELHLAKPWPGRQGIYIDDRAVRPREFVELSFEELEALMERDRLAIRIEEDDV
ncbi:capsular biosynthesis protein [Roseovarius sp. EL26]|uniref:capsular biosynthesis protein n=1 Tax=Roseovarius sp. EL26 TaxID=2126672 RepID=UPI001576EC3C|nr:capsular biosynthesis protein [Roseovarius sp. EL26]